MPQCKTLTGRFCGGGLPVVRDQVWNGGVGRAAVAPVPVMPFVVAQWHSGPQGSGSLPGGLLQ